MLWILSDLTYKQNRPALEGLAMCMLMMTGCQIDVNHIVLDFTDIYLIVKRIVPKYWTIEEMIKNRTRYNGRNDCINKELVQ